MIDKDPINTAKKTQKATGAVPYAQSSLHSMWVPPSSFGWCDSGLANAECIPEAGIERFIELHHLDGWRHDPEFVVPLCPNCHAEVTEGLLQAGVSMKTEGDPINRVAVMLEAEAVCLESYTKAQRRKAELLRNSRK